LAFEIATLVKQCGKQASYLLLAGLLLKLLFNSENNGSTCLQNVDGILLEY
jgi:hypothetical protein